MGDQVSIADLLLKAGADVRAVTKLGFTPLHTACISGCPNAVNTLISNDAVDVNSGDKEGGRPLHWAA